MNLPRIPKKLRLLLLVTYWICGFIATHVPIGGGADGEVFMPHVDKVAHFVLYFFLSLLMAYWLGTDRPAKQTITLTIVICCLYGLLDEGVQTLVPSRNASLFDFLADCLGSILGAICYGFCRFVWGKG